MLLAVLLFALMDAGLKLLSAKYPPLQVAALRGLSSLPFVLAWALLTVPPGSLLRIHWPLHLLRGALGVAMMAGFVYGLRGMPLSTAYAITFVAPLLVTAMAGPLLKERVGLGRWLAIGIGLTGVLVILRPTGEGMMTAGGLAVLVAAICYAAGAITVRLLAQRDSTQAMVVWFMALLSAAALVLAWPGWKPLAAADGWIIGGDRGRRFAGAGRADRGVPAWRGFVDRTAGVHRAESGAWRWMWRVWGVLPDGVDLGRRRNHRRQRLLSAAPRTGARARRGGASLRCPGCCSCRWD